MPIKLSVNMGLPPHRHITIKYPKTKKCTSPGEDVHFFVLELYKILKLTAVWHYPFYKDNQNLEIIFLVENSYSK